MKAMRKNDLILIGVLAAACLAAWLLFLLFAGEGSRVVVTVGGNEVASYTLSENGEHRIEVGEGYNILVIENGEARVVEASCPDKVCVKTHAVSRAGETIVCLPNELVVSVEGGEEADVIG